jgi:DNA-binding beta-propeller fold protein YncE
MRRKRLLVLLAAELLAGSGIARPPLGLVQTIEMPDVPAGPYADHMALDPAGQRLFTTPQAAHAVDVLDLRSGTVLRSIRHFDDPHAVFYRGDRGRLFVTDGKGTLEVLDARSYRRIKSIRLQADADGMTYDPRTELLYVANGGADAGKSYSLVSVIDTAAETKTGDIRIDAPALEAMAIDDATDSLYVNLPDKNAIAVVDLKARSIRRVWLLTRATRNEVFALDSGHHALYVGCNEGDVRGSILVLDTTSGKELDKLAIGSWVDSMFYDARRQRIYASTGIGEVFTYERRSDGGYRALDPVDTAVMARTSLYSAELDRLFVMVPHLGWTPSKVLVFSPLD